MKNWKGRALSHNDKPSNPQRKKVIKTKSVKTDGDVKAPKYSDGEAGVPRESKTIITKDVITNGTTRTTKYSVEEVIPYEGPLGATTKSEPRDDYPITDNEVDIYAVDTRIWDRIKEYSGDGSGGGPHNHKEFAELEDRIEELEERVAKLEGAGGPTEEGHLNTYLNKGGGASLPGTIDLGSVGYGGAIFVHHYDYNNAEFVEPAVGATWILSDDSETEVVLTVKAVIRFDLEGYDAYEVDVNELDPIALGEIIYSDLRN